MSPTLKPAEGSFTWAELGTTDTASAKSFYGALFGWNVMEVPMGPSGVYNLLHVGELEAGGMYELNAEMRSQGVPPHWMVYFAADNADATAAKARQLGAQIIKEPFDVMDIGRMSVITDPTGAFFCIWQSKGGAGLRAQTSIGGPCWPELTTKDRQTAERFYTGLFGWGLKKSEPYTEVQVGGNSVGGIMQMDEKWGPAPSHWGIYFLVANADESAAKAGELGAKVCVPPTDIPNVGRFAVLNDPQGAAFSIIQLSHPM